MPVLYDTNQVLSCKTRDRQIGNEYQFVSPASAFVELMQVFFMQDFDPQEPLNISMKPIYLVMGFLLGG